MVEVTINARDAYIQKIKNLLSNKDKLVGKELKDGRNQYQVEIQKLKDKMKAYKKSGKAVKGEITSFGKLLKSVKKQEREGKFDRGAEGKTKKKLRAKMTKEPEKLFTSGRHKGSDTDIAVEETGIKDIGSDSKANISRIIAGQKTKKKKKSVAASR